MAGTQREQQVQVKTVPMFIFDFDGVIADTLSLYQQVCQQAATARGYQAQLASNPFATLDPVTFEALGETLGIDGHQYAKDVAIRMTASTQIPALFPQAKEVLEQLSREMPLVVLSASHTEVLNRILSHHGIAHCFTSVIGGDKPGSKADKLVAIKAQHNCFMVMVGDGVSDIDAAKAAGIPSVAVNWGWQSADILQQRKPNYQIQTPEQLLPIAAEFLQFAQQGKRA
ncbi:HAD family hydrolase [Photobacterium makurazakiensis]|uniref:HAD family hydrolase n=1 Tax=Photobacterium makurazakiensis TaxID=2910234 RepID=UPI003D107ED5